MEKVESGVSKNSMIIDKKNLKELLYKIALFVVIIIAWQVAANYYDSALLLPTPKATFDRFVENIQNKEVITNISITLSRVLRGFVWALIIGLPLGFLMGLSKLANKLIGGIVDSIRQVPIMAWVPLTIIWFGIGDGPTIFLIAFSGIFPIILNTIQGVRNISPDYYHAARSMGASYFSIFKDVILPASIPDILTGSRIAISSGWMSVIWAEFIATSAGLGYSMVEAQVRMQSDSLISLMFLAAIVGFLIDRTLQLLNKSLTKWRYVK